MRELEQELKRLFEVAWKLQPGPVRNQIFRELEQFRLRISAFQERAKLPERKNAPA
jgi:predicted DCC family thiol-disulfide oxidoreductase YuxK